MAVQACSHVDRTGLGGKWIERCTAEDWRVGWVEVVLEINLGRMDARDPRRGR